MPAAIPAIECRGLKKVFGSVIANNHVGLTVNYGEILAILGENGSGKTTTIKLLNGLLQTAKTTLQGQSPQMVLSFLASQPGFEAWFEANKNKTVGELVGQIGK